MFFSEGKTCFFSLAGGSGDRTLPAVYIKLAEEISYLVGGRFRGI